jgi:hypothetical protein
MKQKSIWLSLVCCILMTGSLFGQSLSYYQLKIYSIEPESQGQRMDAFLKQAYLPALHRAGISKVGVFVPNETESAAGMLIYVLIPFKSLEQFEKLENVLLSDVQFLSDGKDYLDALFDNAPYQRFESIILRAFKEFPELGIPVQSTPVADRVYELRSYQSATEKIYLNKVEMFNEGGEINLFKELGFNPVFFGEVVSGGSMPNLMYMTSFSNKVSQDEHWGAFQKHPTWNRIKEIEKYKNTVSNIDKIMLHPTDYSDL